MADGDTPIGSLRYQVQLVGIVQTPDPLGTGLVESYGTIATVHASILPIGMLTFWTATTPTEETPTHRIRFRGDQYILRTSRILRVRTLWDGSIMTETFQVMRSKMLAGRIRFSECECLLISPVLTFAE